jgi:hypothetical protein
MHETCNNESSHSYGALKYNNCMQRTAFLIHESCASDDTRLLIRRVCTKCLLRRELEN